MNEILSRAVPFGADTYLGELTGVAKAAMGGAPSTFWVVHVHSFITMKANTGTHFERFLHHLEVHYAGQETSPPPAAATRLVAVGACVVRANKVAASAFDAAKAALRQDAFNLGGRVTARMAVMASKQFSMTVLKTTASAAEDSCATTTREPHLLSSASEVFAAAGQGNSHSELASISPQQAVVSTQNRKEPEPCQRALEALYDASGGPKWKKHDKWKTDAPLEQWHGITVSAHCEEVAEMILPGNNLAGMF
jgi:hypothetical protein